jgi:hypothetical protein
MSEMRRILHDRRRDAPEGHNPVGFNPPSVVLAGAFLLMAGRFGVAMKREKLCAFGLIKKNP